MENKILKCFQLNATNLLFHYSDVYSNDKAKVPSLFCLREKKFKNKKGVFRSSNFEIEIETKKLERNWNSLLKLCENMRKSFQETSM